MFYFESEEDRDYYIDKDPAHKAFQQIARPILQSVRVIDFESGIF